MVSSDGFKDRYAHERSMRLWTAVGSIAAALSLLVSVLFIFVGGDRPPASTHAAAPVSRPPNPDPTTPSSPASPAVSKAPQAPSAFVTGLRVPSDLPLSALNGGVDTGLFVHQGEMVHIAAVGIVQFGLVPQSPGCGSRGAPAGMAATDPDGRLTISNITCNRTAPCDACPAATAPVGSLIGRIGTSRWFFVGSDKRLQVPADGELWLGHNDWLSDDNSGLFTVDISPV